MQSTYAVTKADCLQWLNGQSFMEKTATYLDAMKTADSDFHTNSAQLICDVIRFSREQQLQQLKPEDDITLLTPETYANELLRTADRSAVSSSPTFPSFSYFPLKI